MVAATASAAVHPGADGRGSAENYDASPGPFQLTQDVPADWSDTRVLLGAIGECVSIAHQDRNIQH